METKMSVTRRMMLAGIAVCAFGFEGPAQAQTSLKVMVFPKFWQTCRSMLQIAKVSTPSVVLRLRFCTRQTQMCCAMDLPREITRSFMRLWTMQSRWPR